MIDLGRSTEGKVELPLDVLKRHMVCLGSSGSGKTVACKVLCEEFALQGIPVIAVDPQGDIASLILPGDAEAIAAHGGDPARRDEFEAKAEVVIWTPASSKGAALSVNPLGLDGLKDEDAEETVRYLSGVARAVSQFIGEDPDQDKGKRIASALHLVLEHAHGAGRKIGGFADLSSLLSALPRELHESVGQLLDAKELAEAIRQLAVLNIGSRKLLFETGLPLRVDTLLGLDETGVEGKTRISVIYLNTLGSQEEKEFFVACLVRDLYAWMLGNPSHEVQALFYIDEIAPFLPPVKKPACRDGLRLLFKQARKYGVACLAATQNPGDVDYRSISQFSTWNLGRLVTRQDVKKVADLIESVSPGNSERIRRSLPSLEAGRFLLVSPDAFETALDYKVRWLLTQHVTLDDDSLPDLMEETARRLRPPAGPEGAEAPDVPAGVAGGDELAEISAETGVAEGLEEAADDEATPEERLVDFLAEARRALPLAVIAEKLGASRQSLTSLLSKPAVGKTLAKEKVGRQTLYWLKEYGLFPGAGVFSEIEEAKISVPLVKAKKTAEEELRGLFFKDDELAGQAFHLMPLWKVEAVVEKSKGIFRKTKVEERSTLYVEAYTGDLCWHDGGGYRLGDVPDESDPARIFDLDDTAVLEKKFITETEYPRARLKSLKSPAEARAIIERRFTCRAAEVSLTLLPIWAFAVKDKGTGKVRPVYVDAVLGRKMEGVDPRRYKL